MPQWIAAPLVLEESEIMLWLIVGDDKLLQLNPPPSFADYDDVVCNRGERVIACTSRH